MVALLIEYAQTRTSWRKIPPSASFAASMVLGLVFLHLPGL
jgi:hypothetical protein